MTYPGPETGSPASLSPVSTREVALLKWAFWILSALLTVYAFWGIRGIPFHPDESTQLYMSKDFDLLISHPLALVWTPDQAGDGRTHLRLVDAPVTRYLLGLGRSLAGLPALPVDWSWSESWEENRAAGAVPDPRLLLAGRLALTLLLPFSLLMINIIGSHMHGKLTGLLAALLLGTNALVLLHDRRAMAEAALTFGVLFTLWSFLEGKRHPWLVGLGLALAFNAKQTGLALLPVGLVSVVLPLANRQSAENFHWLGLASAWGQVLLVFGLVTGLLNPIMWRQPVQAVQAAIAERQQLLKQQVADHQRLAPDVALDSPSRRLAAILANLYFAPPSFAEAGNYSEQTRASEQAYLADAGHNIFRGMLGGGVMFALNLLGIALALLRLPRINLSERRAIALILLASLCMALGLFWLAPLPWQRFVIPLVPISCLWSAYAVSSFGERPA